MMTEQELFDEITDLALQLKELTLKVCDITWDMYIESKGHIGE